MAGICGRYFQVNYFHISVFIAARDITKPQVAQKQHRFYLRWIWICCTHSKFQTPIVNIHRNLRSVKINNNLKQSLNKNTLRDFKMNSVTVLKIINIDGYFSKLKDFADLTFPSWWCQLPPTFTSFYHSDFFTTTGLPPVIITLNSVMKILFLNFSSVLIFICPCRPNVQQNYFLSSKSP